MKIRLNRNVDDPKEVERILIEHNNVEYRISEHGDGLIINKTSYNENVSNNFTIIPQVSNQIIIG